MLSSGERLDVLKALGDNTRYAIYLELARSAGPRSTAEIAESLGLHGNTVRPHLERMKEVGLLQSRSESAGTVGRPQKLYSLADDAPSLGLEPPVFPMLARMLLDMARAAQIETEVVLEAGRGEGRRRASIANTGASDDVEDRFSDLVEMQQELGFDPAVFVEAPAVEAPASAVAAFTHCPFAELAQQNPGIVCALHRGLVEGFIENDPTMVLRSFNDVTNREPCRMELRLSESTIA